MDKLMFFLRKKANENTDDCAESQQSNSPTLQETTCDPPARVRGVCSPPLHLLNVSPLILSLFQDLNEEQWNKVQENMHSSMTRSQFTSLCSDIATWVSEVATRITLPALALVLDITIIDSSSSSSSSEESLKPTRQSPLELPSEEFLSKEEEAESSVPLPKNIFSQGSSHSVDISRSTRAPPSSFPLQSSGEETSTELTAKNILDIIMKRIFKDAEQVKDLDLVDTKSARTRRLDMLRSTETVRLLSPELVQEVHCFIMVDSNALSVLKTASYRINTELALLKAEGGGRLELARQAFSELVHVFIGKCVRHLLLEFFCLFNQHYDKSEGLISAAAASPGGSLQDVPSSVAQSETSDVCGGKSAQIVLKSSSEVSSNTMEMLVTLMVNEVMKFLSVKIGGFNQGTLRCTAGNKSK